MKEDQHWREPTKEERELLYEHLTEQQRLTHEEASKSLETACMVVLENFTSGSPGYAGRILIVIYGYPETLEAYQFNEDAGGDIWDSPLHRFVPE